MSEQADTKADLSRSAVARYIQLATLFRRRIASGEWAAEQQIPTVDMLAEECGVARATIRQALDLLEREGLISRFRAKGTFVNTRDHNHVWIDVMTNWRGLLNSREGATIEVLADEETTFLPRRLHDLGTPVETYRKLTRRHSRAGERFLIAEVFIDIDLARLIPDEAFTTTTAMRLTSFWPDHVARAEQTIAIGSADMRTAAFLDVPLNSPVGLVDRSVVDPDGRLVLFSKGTYRGDVIRLDMQLK